MFAPINRALDARLKGIKDEEKGFTLIELLVVVIIIGILAAIAIPVYLGIQNNAKDSAAQSDATSAKVAVIAYQTDNQTLPTALTAVAAKYGYTATAGVTTVYTTDSATAPTKFCIQSTSTSTKTFGVTDSSGVAAGTCAAGVFTPAP